VIFSEMIGHICARHIRIDRVRRMTHGIIALDGRVKRSIRGWRHVGLHFLSILRSSCSTQKQSRSPQKEYRCERLNRVNFARPILATENRESVIECRTNQGRNAVHERSNSKLSRQVHRGYHYNGPSGLQRRSRVFLGRACSGNSCRAKVAPRAERVGSSGMTFGHLCPLLNSCLAKL
jgi:hypothetical protein